MKTFLDHIEPALSFAREELKRILTAGAASAAEWHEALAAVDAARAYLVLHRSAEYAYYDPRTVLAFLMEGDATRRHVLLSATGECVGDAEQVRDAVDTLLRNAVLESDAILALELLEEEEVPQLRVSFDGPGRFPERFSIGGFLEIPFDALAARWTVATRGGRIDRTPYGLSLRLKGVRVIPESKEGLEAHTATLLAVKTHMLRLAQGVALPSGKEGAAELRKAIEILESILLALESAERAGEPSNLCVLVQDVVTEQEPELKRAGIAVKLLCDSQMPPIQVRRDRMRSFFVNGLRWAVGALPAGGAVSLLVDYDARARAAGIVVALSGVREPFKDSAPLASMRRAVVESHGGTLDLEFKGSNATVSASLPDPLGRSLDEWIPGWEVFGERAQQMLRILKSGGPTPPEEFLLEGILEDELERWLLPKLEAPPAINLAHEISANHSDLPGASPERLEKALGQIRKRKPRKEVVRPAYAAEILWAYRDDARSRTAVGSEKLDPAQLRALCEALLRRPPDYVLALRLVALALALP